MLPPTQRGTAGAFGIAPPVPRLRRGSLAGATATPPPAYRYAGAGPRSGHGSAEAFALPVGRQGKRGRDGAGAIPGGGSADTRHRPAAPPPPSFTLSGL